MYIAVPPKMLIRGFLFHTWIRAVKNDAITNERETKNSVDKEGKEKTEKMVNMRVLREGPNAWKAKTVMATGGAIRSTKSRKAFTPFDRLSSIPEKKRKGKALQKNITPPIKQTRPMASISETFMMMFVFPAF